MSTFTAAVKCTVTFAVIPADLQYVREVAFDP
jgi:hypothetical protein